ncbi:Ankyrin repeat domain-containing protein 27 [Trichoplax sp. H2]|nr:Ankyrin repeat domain-containing protein 27 [Trichoplax sp. H2]|eukprot:RDD40279.1 Ankyrin repeat domain-containing protein 27 [Trichoplax sp. H2]
MVRYDEDLFDNPFYKAIAGKPELLIKAVAQDWIICVPRKVVAQKLTADAIHFENHVLCPMNTSSGIYKTMSNKVVKIVHDVVRTEKGFKEDRKVQILFEETHYDSSEKSYKVLCLEKALEGGTSNEELCPTLQSCDECNQFLWNDPNSRKCKGLIDALLDKFTTELDSKHDKPLRVLVDSISTIFTKSVQIIMKDTLLPLRKLANEDLIIMANLKLALETYILDFLFDKIFKFICCSTEIEDVNFNKLTRNLGSLPLNEIGLSPSILAMTGEALLQINLINKCRTPLEKMYCLHKTLQAITTAAGSNRALTTDDLLPILVAVMLKAEIPNWIATIIYIKNFHFSNAMAVADEFAFCVTSIEAAMEHIQGESIRTNPTCSNNLEPPKLTRLNSDSKRAFATDEALFETVQCGDTSKVKTLLEGPTSWNILVDKMCHPLCQCPKCEELQKSYDSDPLAATVHSRDDRGNTVLHVASENGHEDMVDLLLSFGAEIDCTNNSGCTPLHLACKRDFPKIVRLLCEKGASMNAVDNDDFTALHFCAENGHEETAKVLLFNEFNGKRASINTSDINGNTPLHIAAKWGYANLVELFVENGASIEARNNNMETALDCSNLSKISQIISLARFARKSSKDDVYRSLASSNVASAMPSVSSKQDSDDRRAKQIKQLFMAIADDDIEMVRFIFGWSSNTPQKEVVDKKKACHPLCQCSECSQNNKSSSDRSVLTTTSTDVKGYTSLHMAAIYGKSEIAAILLREGGANCNVKTKVELLTPLHLACQWNHVNAISILLEHQARINAKNVQGNTPLHLCSANGHIDASLILLSHDAYVNVKNYQGDTPLHLASRWNHAALANLLLDYGASPTIKNNMQLTPLQCAKDNEVLQSLTKAKPKEVNGNVDRLKIIDSTPDG